MSDLSSELVSAINAALKEGFPRHQEGKKPSALMVAIQRLGITRNAARHRLDTAARNSEFPDWSIAAGRINLQPVPDQQARTEVIKLRNKLSSLQSQIQEADRSYMNEADIREKILDLASHTPSPPDWLINSDTSQGVTGVPCTIWSDWHLGEVVTRAETNGVNEFNLEIAEQRIKRLVEKTISLCFENMVNPDYPGIVINLLGDIVSGGLHPELAESDELDIFPMILWAVDKISWALGEMADRFGRVFVACAPGNHGRVFDRKPRAKGYVYRNADWLIYNLLDKAFKNDDRIQFSIPATGECLYRVYDHVYMAVHGDDLGVRGGDGIMGALGPISRGEVKMRHSSAQIGRDYDTLLMGHWHQTLWLPRVHVNNALKGYDEFARRMLRATPTAPAQSLWFTHPRYGITAQWSIYLDETPLSEVTPQWLTWAAA